MQSRGDPMNKIFEKHETLFCMVLIILYIVVNSVCVQNFGYTSSVSFIVNTILSICLVGLVLSLKKSAYYGFTKVQNLKLFLSKIKSKSKNSNRSSTFNVASSTQAIVSKLAYFQIGFGILQNTGSMVELTFP